MSQLYRNTAKIVLGTFIELITCECKNMGYLSHYYLWLIIQVEPSPITPFKALSGPSIYQQLFLFGNRDTDRSPCSNLIKTRLNFYTTLAKSYKHCKLTLNTSYKKKYVGQVEIKRNFLNKKEAELKYIKLIEHCHTSAVILMRFFLSFVNRMVIKGAYWYQIKIHRFEHTLPNETLKQLPFLRSGLLWSSLWWVETTYETHTASENHCGIWTTGRWPFSYSHKQPWTTGPQNPKGYQHWNTWKYY